MGKSAALLETRGLPKEADPAENLLRRIRAREARVCVIGLGYVGLPLVRLFLSKGFPVLGFDVDPKKIERLRRGESYIRSVSPASLRTSRFEATNDPARLLTADAIIICVPTPLASENGRPDLSFIRNTAKTVAKSLRPGQLVVLESTTYPGTTRDILLPALSKRGLRCGSDFFLAFSPEREDPGNRQFTNETIPKIVGGIDEPSRRAASALYGAAVARVVEVSGPEVAESAKLLENIYRCINIALVNELKVCFERLGVDVWEVIAAASTKPFGFQPFYPGPGMGGHCIPVDPFYLTWKARKAGFNTQFINLAGRLNLRMPNYVVEKTQEALGKSLKGARVLVLGLSYKKDIDDPRESPSFRIIELLVEKGATVAYHDPYFPTLPAMRHYRHLKVEFAPLTEESLEKSDVAILATDHSSFNYPWIAEHARRIVDCRNAFRDVDPRWRGKIVKA